MSHTKANPDTTGTLRAYIALKLLTLAIAFLSQVLLAKHLTPAQYATYAVLLATLVAGERALSFGVDRTLMRFVPICMADGHGSKVKRLAAWVGLTRAITFVILGVGIAYSGTYLADHAPIPLGRSDLAALFIWLISFSLYIDADAFAQTKMAHRYSARAATADALIRVCSFIALIWLGSLNVSTILVSSAAVSALTTLCLILHLMRLAPDPCFVRAENEPGKDRRSSVTALRFSVANYASTLCYLITSPPVIRIVAAGGLAVLPLASFSFVQTLAMSLQRVLPGMLILPSLEPLIMRRTDQGLKAGDNAVAWLALVFKSEIFVLCIAGIFISAAGKSFVNLLSRPEYADYYWILFILLATISLATTYRIMEIIANANFKQRYFFYMWPISLISTICVLLSVEQFGLLAVLLIPAGEILLRVSILVAILRSRLLVQIFDIKRNGAMLLLASMLCGVVLSLQRGGSDMLPIITYTILPLTIFTATLSLLRPLSSADYRLIRETSPQSFRYLVHIARHFAEK